MKVGKAWVKKTCLACGKIFSSRVCLNRHSPVKYCSQKCYFSTKEHKVEYTCKTCGKGFSRYKSTNENPIYCSRECYNKTRMGEFRNCKKCGKEFYAIPYKVKNGFGIYCSRRCMGYRVKRKCKQCKKQFATDLNNVKRGWGKFCSRECGFEYRRQHSKNGRKDKRYYEWRDAVYDRDDRICQKCGERHKDINAHHIYAYKFYPEKRYDVDNGITLCDRCHAIVHNIYGYNYASIEEGAIYG